MGATIWPSTSKPIQVSGFVITAQFCVWTATIAPTHFSWDYTTILNLVCLGLFAVLYWLYRNRERLGGGAGLAMDPMCGMQVRTADAPARSSYGGQRFWFCSDRCRERFDADPARFASPPAGPGPDLASRRRQVRRPDDAR